MHRGMPGRLHLRGRLGCFTYTRQCVDVWRCDPCLPVESIYYEDDVPDIEPVQQINATSSLNADRPVARRKSHDQTTLQVVKDLPPQGEARLSKPGERRRNLGVVAGVSPGTPCRPTSAGQSAPGRHSSTCPSARPRPGTPLIRKASPQTATPHRGYPTTAAPCIPRIGGRRALGRRYRRHRMTETPCCPFIGTRNASPGCRPCSVSAPRIWSGCRKLAYPTYDVGARLAGTGALRDSLTQRVPRRRQLVYVKLAEQSDVQVPVSIICGSFVGWAAGTWRAGGILRGFTLPLGCGGVGWDAEPSRYCIRRCATRPHRSAAVALAVKSSSLAGYRAASAPGTPPWSARCWRAQTRRMDGARAVQSPWSPPWRRPPRSRAALPLPPRRDAFATGIPFGRLTSTIPRRLYQVTRGEACRDNVALLAQRGSLRRPRGLRSAGAACPGGVDHHR